MALVFRADAVGQTCTTSRAILSREGPVRIVHVQSLSFRAGLWQSMESQGVSLSTWYPRGWKRSLKSSSVVNPALPGPH